MFTRRRRKSDANQAAIVAALRADGATVEVLSDAGRGCPDLLVGVRGRNLLIEVKGLAGGLTPVQRTWHQTWRGQAAVVTSPEEAIQVVRGDETHG